MHAEVELHVYADFAPCIARRTRHLGRRIRRIERDRQTNGSRQRSESPRTRSTDRRICDEHVIAHLRHGFGFTRRGAGQSSGAKTKLRRCDVWSLVCLDVWAEREAMLRCVLSRARQIPVEPVEIDHDRRCFERSKLLRHVF
jgi:hypothetical protein